VTGYKPEDKEDICMTERDKSGELVYVAFGSNIGNRINNVSRMMILLEDLGVSNIRCSSLWLSEPLDMAGVSEVFINGVIEMRTTLSAAVLLGQLQHIEITLGRPADHGNNTSRVMDLDIVSYGDEHIVTDELVVPHPRVSERLFVLKPLVELAPELKLWGCDNTVAELVELAPPMKISLHSPR